MDRDTISSDLTIFPRNAMLARYMLWSGICLSVRLSVCHKPVFYRNGWTDEAAVLHRWFPRLVELYTGWGQVRSKPKV